MRRLARSATRNGGEKEDTRIIPGGTKTRKEQFHGTDPTPINAADAVLLLNKKRNASVLSLLVGGCAAYDFF